MTTDQHSYLLNTTIRQGTGDKKVKNTSSLTPWSSKCNKVNKYPDKKVIIT